MKILISITLAFLVSYVSLESTNLLYLLQYTDTSRNSTFCTQAGYACKSCNESVLCVQNGTNFSEVAVVKCGSNNTCLNGICTTAPNPKCSHNITEVKPSFICRTPGMFPDPDDCQTFHHCVKSNTTSTWGNSSILQFTDRCGCGYSYNMSTTFCDIPMRNSSCGRDYPLTSCYRQGQTASLRNNPSLYYICEYHPNHASKLYPFFYACENGKRYDSYEYLCK